MSTISARGVLARARLVIAWLVPLLLLAPMYDTLPRAQWAGRIWLRVMKRDGIRLGNGRDAAIRTLLPFLPSSGDIGFSNAGGDPTDESWFRVQYALAPRRVVNDTKPEFVVETGAADTVPSLSHAAAFALVTSSGDDLRLYRRIAR